MCGANYSGPFAGTYQQFLSKGKGTAGGGVSTGGYAGPSTSAAAVMPRIRKSAAAGNSMLDDMFGPRGG